MKPKIPDSRFQEDEAARLIASYGNKPAPEKRQDIKNELQAQRELFLEMERKRGAEKERGHDQ